MRALTVLIIFFSFAFAQEITIWTTFTGADLDWLNNQSQLYSELFKQKVKITSLSIGEINQKMFLSKTDSNIKIADLLVGLSHEQVPYLHQEGLLADMQPFTTQEYLDDLYKNAREAFSIDSQLVGFPLYVEGPALIINRDLVAKTPESFEELVRIAKDFEASNETEEELIGFRFDVSNLYFAYPFLTSHGAKLFADGKINIENADFIKGAKFLRDLKFKYQLFEHTSGYKENVENFYFSRQAMIYDGPWSLKTYAQANLNLTIAPLPTTESGLELPSFAKVYGLVLTKNKVNIDTINLAKWLSRFEAQLDLSKMTDKIPSSNKATENLDNELIIGFARALAHADLIPSDDKMPRSWGPISKALFKILVANNSNIKGIFKQAAYDINQTQ